MSEFEKAVKKALIDHDMTMQDLADALGITISYVSDLIKGKRKNELQLAKIASFLGLSEADYAEQTDQPCEVH